MYPVSYFGSRVHDKFKEFNQKHQFHFDLPSAQNSNESLNIDLNPLQLPEVHPFSLNYLCLGDNETQHKFVDQ